MSTQSTGSQTASKSPSSARFASRTALVTGAAGDIGKAAALRFIAEGANVVLVDLSSAEERLGQLAQEVGAERSLVVTADVTKRSEVEKAFAEGAKRFGRVDFVFNNAGIQVRCQAWGVGRTLLSFFFSSAKHSTEKGGNFCSLISFCLALARNLLINYLISFSSWSKKDIYEKVWPTFQELKIVMHTVMAACTDDKVWQQQVESHYIQRLNYTYMYLQNS